MIVTRTWPAGSPAPPVKTITQQMLDLIEITLQPAPPPTPVSPPILLPTPTSSPPNHHYDNNHDYYNDKASDSVSATSPEDDDDTCEKCTLTQKIQQQYDTVTAQRLVALTQAQQQTLINQLHDALQQLQQEPCTCTGCSRKGSDASLCGGIPCQQTVNWDLLPTH